MDPTSTTAVFLGLVFLFLAIAGLATNAWLCTRIAAGGGKVPVEKFDFADLFAGVILIALLIFVIITGFTTPQREVHDTEIICNAILDLTIVAFLCSFMHFRGINLPVQFGLRALGPGKVVGLAVLLLLAAYPMMLFASGIALKFMPDAKPQALVKSFIEASQHMEYRTLVYTFITGTVVAPFAEEFVFRGYIHGFLKRYLGIAPGAVLNAALFAAVHVNALSLPALFIFAICLTIAYEFTGSILVNMCMHSLFNLSQFCMLIYVSHLAAASWPK